MGYYFKANIRKPLPGKDLKKAGYKKSTLTQVRNDIK